MREFWANKSCWPNDPRGYVFFARAIDELGQATYGSAWTGAECVVEVLRVLPAKFSDKLNERLQIYDFLKQHRPDIDLPPLRPGGSFGIRAVSLTPEQWELAVSTNKQIMNDARPSLLRLANVQADIVRQCEAGALLSYYRSTAGGELHSIPSSWWNTERSYARFTMCQINPRRPFNTGFAGDDYAWIFISRESLDRYTSQLPHKQLANMPSHLSPYMCLMLLVAEELEITPENQPKKETVVAKLREAWPRTIPTSAKLIETMATLLREPSSQLGRAIPTKNLKNEA